MIKSSALSDPSQRERQQRQENLAAFAASAFAILICLFGNLGALGLVGPDDPRYSWIARAMAQTGDWVTPRLYGAAWFEKPILYYWAAAIGFRMHLPNEWAARLPSAIAALVATIVIGWLAWQHYGEEEGLVRSPALGAPLLFATSVAAIGFSRAATPDMLFAGSLALAMMSAAGVLRRAGILRRASIHPAEPDSWRALWLVLFGAWLGVAVLAKGPAGLILAGGALLLWAAFTGHWRAVLRFAHPAAIASCCVVALPWYWLCARRNPDFLRVFIFQHNFERYLTPLFMHRQPFWFFGPILLVALLPWTVFLIPTIQEGLKLWREKSFRNSPGFFFACWAVFPVLFFSLSQSKLPSYILPAIPPLVLLMAVGARRSRLAKRPSAHWTFGGVGLTWVALGIAAIAWLHTLPAGTREIAGPFIEHGAVIALLGGLLIVILGLTVKRAAVLCSFFVVILLVGVANVRALPALDSYFSARPYAEALRNDRHPERVFEYRIKRSWDYGLAFYMRRRIPEWSPNDPEPALVLTSPAGLAELKKLGRVHGEIEEGGQTMLFAPVAPAHHREPETAPQAAPPIEPQSVPQAEPEIAPPTAPSTSEPR